MQKKMKSQNNENNDENGIEWNGFMYGSVWNAAGGHKHSFARDSVRLSVCPPLAFQVFAVAVGQIYMRALHTMRRRLTWSGNQVPGNFQGP